MAGSCQHSNGPLNAIKCGVFLQGQRDYLLLRKDCSLELITWLVSQLSEFILQMYSFHFLLYCMNSVAHDYLSLTLSCNGCSCRLVNALAVSFSCVPAVSGNCHMCL
jgi:hypothetical protein